MISPATKEQIRAASDIVDVIGGYIPLKRAGANFVALCPFHKEKTPSFNVSPQRQFFHCFGCHKGGDVFTFVREYENIDFMDAVRRLAERARIPLEMESAGRPAAIAPSQGPASAHSRANHPALANRPGRRSRRRRSRAITWPNAASPPRPSSSSASATRPIFGTTRSTGPKANILSRPPSTRPA